MNPIESRLLERRLPRSARATSAWRRNHVPAGGVAPHIRRQITPPTRARALRRATPTEAVRAQFLAIGWIYGEGGRAVVATDSHSDVLRSSDAFVHLTNARAVS